MSGFQIDKAVKKFIRNHELPPIKTTIEFDSIPKRIRSDMLLASFWIKHVVQGKERVFLSSPFRYPNLSIDINDWDEDAVQRLISNAPYYATFVPLLDEIAPARGCTYEAPLRWGVPCTVTIDKVFDSHEIITRARSWVRIENFMLYSPDMMEDWRKLLLKIQKEFGKKCVEHVLSHLS